MNEVLVLGGGLMGSATAWQLAKEGVKVTVVEKQGREYATGSSFGRSRITRSLGPKGDIFSWLNDRSAQEVREMIEFLAKAIPSEEFKLGDIYQRSPVTYLFYQSNDRSLDHLIRGEGENISFANNPDQAKDWFEMAIEQGMQVVREDGQYAGTMDPIALIQLLHRAIVLKGGEVKYGHQVIGIYPDSNDYSIELLDHNSGIECTLRAEKIVLAGGPHNSELIKMVSPENTPDIVSQRVALGFFQLTEESFARLGDAGKQRLVEAFPVIEFSSDLMYAMIEEFEPGGNPVFKIGGHQLREDIRDLDNVWTIPLSQKEVNWGRQTLGKYISMLNLKLSGGDLQFQKGYSCVYAVAPNEIPIIKPAGSEKLMRECIFIGGMSGVGAKGALAYGLIASDLLLGNTRNDLMYRKTAAVLSGEMPFENITTLTDWVFGVQ